MLTQSLVAAACLLLSAQATPTGNHTCTGVVKHEVTVRVNVTEPVTFRAYEWCLRVPPRCSTYTIQLKDRVKIHKEMHNRTITVCCKGYVEIDYKCVPACPPETECPNMHCNRTNHCYCTPGYAGLYCNHPCPKGVWGAGCIKPCDCPPGYTCHHLTGDCMIDDSPPPKTRRTTTAEYLTEAATTLDTTQPTTNTPTTMQKTQPTTRTTTTTTTSTTTPTIPTTTTTTSTTTTTTTTTEKPSTTTTTRPTTTTTERPSTTTTMPTTETPTTTVLQTQPPPLPTTQPATIGQQTTTPTTTTSEQTTHQTSAPVPTIQNNFEDTEIPTTATTVVFTTSQEIEKIQKKTPPLIHIQTMETTSTPKKPPVESTSTTTSPPPPLAIVPSITAPPPTDEEKKTDTTGSTIAATIAKITPAPTTEQTTRTTAPISTTTTTKTTTTTTTAATEPSLIPSTTPSATQVTVQTTRSTTQLPTTTPTETLPTRAQTELHTEPTILPVPPLKFDHASVTIQEPRLTEATEITHLLATVPLTTTNAEPTTQFTTTTNTEPTTQFTTTTTSTTTEKQPEHTTTTTQKMTEQSEAPSKVKEVLKVFTTATSQLDEKKLGVWGTNQFGFEAKIDAKKSKSQQSVVKIGLTEQHLATQKTDAEDRNGKEQILEKPREHKGEKLSENMGQVLTSTTDGFDRMIIEDVRKPAAPKPTADDSPIKLVEEVISKYFPDTFLKPSKAQSSDKGKGESVGPEKSIITPWLSEAKEKTTIKSKAIDTTEALCTEEETKSHPRTFLTTTTIPSPTTPDISTIPIITPKVIVSAKNPDEIDLGGVIYRKMKFFPLAKSSEEPNQKTPPPTTTPSINLHSPTLKEPTTPVGDRFKIYLPEYEKSTEKMDSETTEAPTVRTFLPKFNFDKEDLDYGKPTQPKKAKQKEKEVKKYKIKPNEPTLPPTSAEEVENERVTNNVFLQTKEFKVHLATTKAAKFGDGYYTKSDQESLDFGKLQKKKPKYGSPEHDPTRFVKYTAPPDSVDLEDVTKEGNFPTTNAKPPHTWYSHAREKAKIKNAFKIMKSTIGLDLNAKPTEESSLDESNDINSMATHFTEREPRSAAVTYQEDLNNPQMFGQVKFNAPEGFLSSIDDEGVNSGIYASVAVGGGCFVAMAALVAVIWLRLKGKANPMESSVSFEDGDVRNPVRIGQPGASYAIGDYETVYPIASESDDMEVATFFCPTFTNNYAERINREFKEMSYDHPRSSFAEPLYAEILHPKIKDVVDTPEK